MAKPNVKKTTKKKVQIVKPIGNAYVFSGYNNVILTVTDLTGGAVCWGSAGSVGFKGSRKSTPYAATQVGLKVAKEAYDKGVREVSVYLKGVGNAKSQCVKALRNGGLMISKIVDVTPRPFNGCKPKKRRRT